MDRRRNLLLAGGSVLIAFGAGQYLQSGSARSAAAVTALPPAETIAHQGAPLPSPAGRDAAAHSGDRLSSFRQTGTAVPTGFNATQPPVPTTGLSAVSADSADRARLTSFSAAPTAGQDTATVQPVFTPDPHITAPGRLASATGTSSDTGPFAGARAPSVSGVADGDVFADSTLQTDSPPLVTRDGLSPATLSPSGTEDVTLASATDTAAAAGSPAPERSTARAALAALTNADATTPPDAASSETCPVTLDLFADRDATLALTLTAPCRPNEGVVLHHAGMSVTYQTTATGSLFLDFPALDAAGDVSIRFPDGTEVSAMAPVPELATLQRLALQWVDGDSFALVTDAPVTTLGTAVTVLPMYAQVVTLPASDTPLSIETEVTDRTCGREALGAVFYSDGGQVHSSDLALAMPDCDGAGGYVVLNNPVADMKLAAAE